MLTISKILNITALIVLFSFSLSACNTVAGIGEDIGAVGNKIEKSAKKNKKYK